MNIKIHIITRGVVMNAKAKYWTSVIKNVLIFLISLILIYISFKLAIFYVPFLIGFIISLLIEPIIKKLAEKTGIARKTSAIIVLIIIFSILIGLILWGVITLITESSDLLDSINVYIDKIYLFMKSCMGKLQAKQVKLPARVTEMFESCTTELLTYITKYASTFLTESLEKITMIPIAFIYITITILSTYFICADRFYILDQLEHHVPRLWVRKFGNHVREISSILGNYLKAEVILVIISFFVVLIGLYIGKITGLPIEYPLLCALGIAFVDALPILGSGTVMIPWAIISALDGKLSLSLLLIGLYILVAIIRQVLEPKLVSNRIGTHPIFTLIAMYTGFKIIGIMGLFLGPIVLIILKNIFSQMIDDGIVKTIFNRG